MKTLYVACRWRRFVVVWSLIILAGCATPAPTITPASGQYGCPQLVTLSDSRTNATILYTTDGSVPGPSSEHYLGPFQITANAAVQAVAGAPGRKQSRVVTAAYSCGSPMTNADFAAIMQRQFELPQPSTPVRYVDVDSNDPRYPAIEAVSPFLGRQVLCPGCVLAAKFSPDQVITRAQGAVFLVTVLMARNGLQLGSTAEATAALEGVSDARVLSPIAKRYVATALRSGLMSLRANRTVEAHQPESMEEFAATLTALRSYLPVQRTREK